jgi:transcriptional regulator with XRE-family HTH domain
MITPYQLRMARAALRWNRAKLVRRSGVSLSTVQRLERPSSEPRNHLVSSMIEIIDCLKSEGVTFLPAKAGYVPGIRFQERLLPPQGNGPI